MDLHFASVIDLNNDCFSDLMIVSYQESQKSVNKTTNSKTYQLEVYEKQSNNNYSLARTVKLLDSTSSIEEIHMVTFSDLDNAGSVDLVFLYKSNGNYYLKALMNSFVP